MAILCPSLVVFDIKEKNYAAVAGEYPKDRKFDALCSYIYNKYNYEKKEKSHEYY